MNIETKHNAGNGFGKMGGDWGEMGCNRNKAEMETKILSKILYF